MEFGFRGNNLTPTMYLATARDKDGNIFEAGKIYQLTIPEEAFYNKSFQLADVDRVR